MNKETAKKLFLEERERQRAREAEKFKQDIESIRLIINEIHAAMADSTASNEARRTIRSRNAE